MPPASPSPASPTTTRARPPRPAATSCASRPAPRSSTSAPTRSTRRSCPGNIEHFIGVAQVPIGHRRPAARRRRARPRRVLRPAGDRRGHARRLLQPRHEAAPRGRRREDDRHRRPHAARAGVRVRGRPRGARLRRVARRALRRDQARSPSRPRTSGRLQDIEQYSASRILYTRFNYTTGDAAGQNMTGKATQARLPLDHRAVPRRSSSFFLESQLRHRQEDLADQHAAHARQARRGRGDRSRTRCSRRSCTRARELMFRARQVSNLGGFMSGVNNNGAHSANGITAMFIATGQDVANVAESSAALHLRRAARERRLLLLGHDPVADRRHLRRRHRAGHPARVPRAARLLRRRQGPQARRDRGRDRAVRRALARLGDRRRGVGRGPRPATAATGRADDCFLPRAVPRAWIVDAERCTPEGNSAPGAGPRRPVRSAPRAAPRSRGDGISSGRTGRSPSGRPSVAMKISPIPVAISVFDL